MKIINPYRFGSAGPVTLVSDTFTDTDGTALASHTPDTDTVGGGWVVSAGTWAIVSNEASETSDATSQLAAYIETNEADVVVSGYVTAGASAPARIMVRFTDINNFWVAEIHSTLGFRIREMNAGTLTVRATGAGSYAGSNPLVEVTCSGSTITATADGADEISYGSATHNQAATKHGLCCYGAAGAFDDFAVSTL